jgi:hypothetical protein
MTITWIFLKEELIRQFIYISKGISADRISGKGFGESELKVNAVLNALKMNMP